MEGYFFWFDRKRDEIRRSINKTNIHAFLKHYYYKYWLTPDKPPRACMRKIAFDLDSHSRLSIRKGQTERPTKSRKTNVQRFSLLSQ